MLPVLVFSWITKVKFVLKSILTNNTFRGRLEVFSNQGSIFSSSFNNKMYINVTILNIVVIIRQVGILLSSITNQ